MFENVKPISAANLAPIAGGSTAEHPLQSSAASTAARQVTDAALRSIEWSELTARLSAARDLRALLRRDARSQEVDASGNFATEAAGYFSTKQHSEPNVNPVALGGSKGSPGISPELQEPQHEEANGQRQVATGDAREY